MIAKRPPRTAPAEREAYRLGERVPSRIVEPESDEDVAAQVRAAADAGESVVVFGGGTLQRAANPPSRYDVALLTARLDRVHEYDPRDLTIGAGAGMTVEALQHTLAEHRQFFPFDAPFAGRATVGGTLAAGWAGPRRAAYGRPRDLLIGITAALADGTLARSGGMVVKNVTGYDMGKLYAGSHGTLGAIVRANVKVLPLPAVRRLAIAPFDDELRTRTLAHLGALTTEPAALVIVEGFPEAPGPAEQRALVLLEGSEEVVERATRELRSALGAAGVAETLLFDGDAAGAAFQSLLDAYASPAGTTSATFIARGLPSEALARAERVRARIERAETIADLRTGDVAVRVRDAAGAVRAVLGAARLLCAGGGVHVDAWGEPPSSLAVMRALKERFDPRATLAPGRYVGGI